MPLRQPQCLAQVAALLRASLVVAVVVFPAAEAAEAAFLVDSFDIIIVL